MELLLLSDVSIDSPSSGSENVLLAQASGLNINRNNVYAITRKNGKSHNNQFNNVNGVKTFYYNADPTIIVTFTLALIKEPAKILNDIKSSVRFSAVICHQPFTCLALLIRGMLKRLPILYVFHSPNHEEYRLSKNYTKWYEGFPESQIRKAIEGYCLKHSRKIMVLSDYMKQRIIDIHGLDKDKIVINPGGVDLDYFRIHKNRSKIKDELKFPRGKIHFLTVRNLEPRMGLDNLLKALSMLKENIDNLHLTIGGEGPEKRHIIELIKRYKLMEDITLTGFIPQRTLSKYYGAADFFVLPTRELEGFGLVTPESMACGTPVLGTPVGGTNEILLPFNHQLVFKNSSPEAIADGIRIAIHKYFNNQVEYKKLRLKCRQYIEKNYSWKRHIGQLQLTIADLQVQDTY